MSPVTKSSRGGLQSAWRRNGRGGGAGGFTLLEILLSLALVAMMLTALNTFVFSMGELWGKGTDVHLFELHTRAVTRFIDHELHAAALPPAIKASNTATPITVQEVRPPNGFTEKLLTFELPAGCRLFVWPERPLPEVVCSLQVRERDGLFLLWHSRLEKRFDDDPPRETLVSPLVNGISYDYYEPDSNHWTTETALKLDTTGNPMAPQRIRLKFSYNKMTKETVITLPAPTAALPLF